MNNGLFLPLEVLKREYIGKMLLAVEMATRGMPVYIGHKRRVIDLALEAKEPGVFFYKDGGKGLAFMNELRRKGFGLVAQDEEAGIVFNEYARFYAARPGLKNIPNLDAFFCWGRDEYQYLSEIYEQNTNCKLVNTGSVKTVLWGKYGIDYFQEDIDKFRRRYGKYVVFPTNFKTANNYLPKEDMFELRKRGAVVTTSYEEAFEKDARLMKLVEIAAKRIIDKTKYAVVIRPHPVEDIERWNKVAKGVTGLHIQSEGDFTPLILGAECVLQNSCTSGIQAAVSGIPLIAYAAVESDFVEARGMPNDLGLKAVGEAEILERVMTLDKYWDQLDSVAQQKQLERKLEKPGTKSPISVTANAILEISGIPNIEGNQDLGRDTILYDIKELKRMSRFRRRNMDTILDQAKRPTIAKTRVRYDVERLAKLLGHSKQLHVSRVAPNTFRISSLA